MIISKKKSPVKIKPFIFGQDEVPEAVLKIGVGLESVGTTTSQLSGLVLSLVKFELIRRGAYDRWRLYLNQVGLRLKDLIAYLNVLHDDEELIRDLKKYYYKSHTPEVDKTQLLQEAHLLREQLIEKINRVRILNSFPIHKVR